MPPVKARALALLDDVRSSYWFIPTLMAIGAAVLSVVAVEVDAAVGPAWIHEVSWLYGNNPDGARAVLSTIAGSMIGVAGVTFSITIASVVYASGQYGPRLLTNFMRDQGNQVTLGTFVATFLYCLLVLRTIQDEQGEMGPGDVGAFVPHVAIVVGLALALASVAVFIFFIHHVPESIHVSNVIAGIGQHLRGHLDTLFPARIGEAQSATPSVPEDGEAAAVPDAFFADARSVDADGTGYVRSLDIDGLLRVAEEHDLLVRIRHRPGDFVSDGDSLALVWPPDRAEGAADDLRAAFAWGTQRTALQDVRFLVNELVEIAARALSPGVNDPFTAISCLDWLAAALKALASRDFPSTDRYADDGTLRVVARPTTFDEFVDGVYGQLRPYVAADRNAALHALKTIGEVASRAATEDRRRPLREQADGLLAGAEEALPLESDKEAVRERHRVVRRLLAGHVGYEEAAGRWRWVGGSAEGSGSAGGLPAGDGRQREGRAAE